jgi:S-disulfanyl-L-cysteine oxidoreductase SoxD
MSRFSKTGVAVLLSVVMAGAAIASERFPGIGRMATEAEVKAWDIDVRPDFKGLPQGRGDVARGETLWEAQCASCHGSFGESNEVFTPLVGGTTLKDIETGRVGALIDESFPQRSTLMKVPTVSTLFDYIHRAMPWTSPKSLTPDDTYALLAYLLNLGEIVPANFELSHENIAEVQNRMPNRNGMTTDHGMWPGAPASKGGIGNGGKPDVKNTACMKDCKKEVVMASALPEHAQDAHGNLAEQNRLVGAVRGAATGPTQAEVQAKLHPALSIATEKGCMACHGQNAKIVGPGYNEIAAKYKGQADATALLITKVKNGGQGTWGAIPMPPQPHVSDDEAKTLVNWILSGAPSQ